LMVGSTIGAGLAMACKPEPVPPAKTFKQFDHVVVVMFENRSFDNLLGWLYEREPPLRGQTFDGVADKNLANPIPPDADQASRGSVRVGKGVVMDMPNPDPGEEYPHVNTQLFGTIIPESNRHQDVAHMVAPFNLPASVPAAAPMNGFVSDYISTFWTERGRDPLYEEYKVIMDCFPPEALPVFSTLARQFAVFDRWHCAVPSQTFTNRSFFHAASASGRVINIPYVDWVKGNSAETIFERIEGARGRGFSWKVYFDPTDGIPLTALIHFPRLKGYLGTHFAHIEQFYDDARDGRLPSYSFIEPRLFFNHNDAHPPIAELGGKTFPSSVLAAEILLNDIYNAVRTSASTRGSNYQNTLLLITFDEHGGCYDHVPPPAAVPPDPDAPPGQMDFRFDRAGVRVPTVLVSAYTEAGTIINAPFEHTALIKTLSRQWGLGHLTERDRAAPDLSIAFNRTAPRDRATWPVVTPRPLDNTATNNLGLKVNALQRATTGLATAIFDDVSTVERDVHTVGDALSVMKGVGARLGL
jgi:phospholipase C